MDKTQRSEYAKLLKSLMPERGGKQRPVYVVNGPPGGGKTTYVKDQMQPGDIVIDVDAICAALAGSDNPHGEHEAVLGVGLDVRDSLLETIERKSGKWNRAWVISAGRPDEARALADRLRGEVITVKPTKEQCLEQIRQDTSRAGREALYTELAEKWYAGE